MPKRFTALTLIFALTFAAADPALAAEPGTPPPAAYSAPAPHLLTESVQFYPARFCPECV